MFFSFTQKFISSKDEALIVEAISKAEQKTSGEIRVHIENVGTKDYYQRALSVFIKLKMHATEQRNGTLIYVNPKHKKVVILGDEGINAVVTKHFWDDIVADMGSSFGQKLYTEGIVRGVERVGDALKDFFPYRNDDKNELPNAISR